MTIRNVDEDIQNDVVKSCGTHAVSNYDLPQISGTWKLLVLLSLAVQMPIHPHKSLPVDDAITPGNVTYSQRSALHYHISHLSLFPW